MSKPIMLYDKVSISTLNMHLKLQIFSYTCKYVKICLYDFLKLDFPDHFNMIFRRFSIK